MSSARPDISEIRQAWKDANLAPLWENARAHRPAPAPEPAHLWSWQKIRPLLSAAIDIASPDVGGAARAAARRAQTPSRAAHLEDARGQYSNSLAGRKSAPTPAHDECSALRPRGLGCGHGRGWKALSHGGGRSHPHTGMDLARAYP